MRHMKISIVFDAIIIRNKINEIVFRRTHISILRKLFIFPCVVTETYCSNAHLNGGPFHAIHNMPAILIEYSLRLQNQS